MEVMGSFPEQRCSSWEICCRRDSQADRLARGGWRIFMKSHSQKTCLHDFAICYNRFRLGVGNCWFCEITPWKTYLRTIIKYHQPLAVQTNRIKSLLLRQVPEQRNLAQHPIRSHTYCVFTLVGVRSFRWSGSICCSLPCRCRAGSSWGHLLRFWLGRWTPSAVWMECHHVTTSFVINFINHYHYSYTMCKFTRDEDNMLSRGGQFRSVGVYV